MCEGHRGPGDNTRDVVHVRITKPLTADNIIHTHTVGPFGWQLTAEPATILTDPTNSHGEQLPVHPSTHIHTRPDLGPTFYLVSTGHNPQISFSRFHRSSRVFLSPSSRERPIAARPAI